MPHNYIWPSLITALALVLYAVACGYVLRVRQRSGIRAPAVAGAADFDRAFRNSTEHARATGSVRAGLVVVLHVCLAAVGCRHRCLVDRRASALRGQLRARSG